MWLSSQLPEPSPRNVNVIQSDVTSTPLDQASLQHAHRLLRRWRGKRSRSALWWNDSICGTLYRILVKWIGIFHLILESVQAPSDCTRYVNADANATADVQTLLRFYPPRRDPKANGLFARNAQLIGMMNDDSTWTICKSTWPFPACTPLHGLGRGDHTVDDVDAHTHRACIVL